MPGVDAPAASCVMRTNTRVSHHRSTEITRHSRTRMVLTAYSVLSPATNSSCHRRQQIKAHRTRMGRFRLRELDTSNGCQDHTALPSASASFVSRAWIAHGPKPALRSPCAPNATASTASRPTFVTMANAPLSGETGEVVGVICLTG